MALRAPLAARCMQPMSLSEDSESSEPEARATRPISFAIGAPTARRRVGVHFEQSGTHGWVAPAGAVWADLISPGSDSREDSMLRAWRSALGSGADPARIAVRPSPDKPPRLQLALTIKEAPRRQRCCFSAGGRSACCAAVPCLWRARCCVALQWLMRSSFRSSCGTIHARMWTGVMRLTVRVLRLRQVGLFGRRGGQCFCKTQMIQI